MSDNTNLILHRHFNKRDQYYKTINLTSILDKNLSFKAKGLHIYIMTRPENWQLYMYNLFTISKNRESSVRSAFNELIDNNYIHRISRRNNKGRVIKVEYHVFSNPIKKPNLESLDNQDPVNQDPVNQDPENQVHSNKINSNKINTDEKEREDILLDKYDFSNHKEKPLVRKYQSSFEIFSIKLIQHWSSFDHVYSHDIKNKTYLKMIKDLIALQKGTFRNSGKIFDIDWIKKSNIPEEWFSRAWTYQELKDGLNQANKYALEEYWPNTNKNNYKHLSQIIYNPRKQNSLLFTAIANPPKLLKDTLWKNPLPKTTEELMKNPIWPKSYKFDEKRLAKGLIEIKDFAKGLINDEHRRLSSRFGSLSKLLGEYILWINEEGWIEMNEGIIGTNNKIWDKFIKWQEENFKVPIRSKNN